MLITTWIQIPGGRRGRGNTGDTNSECWRWAANGRGKPGGWRAFFGSPMTWPQHEEEAAHRDHAPDRARQREEEIAHRNHARASQDLQQFHLTAFHRPGKTNAILTPSRALKRKNKIPDFDPLDLDALHPRAPENSPGALAYTATLGPCQSFRRIRIENLGRVYARYTIVKGYRAIEEGRSTLEFEKD
jgi:hypothetical protein